MNLVLGLLLVNELRWIRSKYMRAQGLQPTGPNKKASDRSTLHLAHVIRKLLTRQHCKFAIQFVVKLKRKSQRWIHLFISQEVKFTFILLGKLRLRLPLNSNSIFSKQKHC